MSHHLIGRVLHIALFLRINMNHGFYEIGFVLGYANFKNAL